MIYETQSTVTLTTDDTLDGNIAFLNTWQNGLRPRSEMTPDKLIKLIEVKRLLSPAICVMPLPEREPVTLAQAIAYRAAGELVTRMSHERQVMTEVSAVSVPILVLA